MTAVLSNSPDLETVETRCGRTVTGTRQTVLAGHVRRGDAVVDHAGDYRYVDVRRIDQPCGFADIPEEDDLPEVRIYTPRQPMDATPTIRLGHPTRATVVVIRPSASPVAALVRSLTAQQLRGALNAWRREDEDIDSSWREHQEIAHHGRLVAHLLQQPELVPGTVTTEDLLFWQEQTHAAPYGIVTYADRRRIETILARCAGETVPDHDPYRETLIDSYSQQVWWHEVGDLHRYFERSVGHPISTRVRSKLILAWNAVEPIVELGDRDVALAAAADVLRGARRRVGDVEEWLRKQITYSWHQWTPLGMGDLDEHDRRIFLLTLATVLEGTPGQLERILPAAEAVHWRCRPAQRAAAAS